MEEYLSLLVQTSAEGTADLPGAAQRWHRGAARLAELVQSEGGQVDSHHIEQLPDSLADRSEAFLASPAVASTYLTSVPSVALVPLDGLIVYQHRLNLSYAEQLAERVAPSWRPDDPQFFDFCLALDQSEPAVDGIQVNANSFVFSSPSTDVRFLGAKLVDSRQVGGYTPPGRPMKAVVLYVGYSVNAINVLEIDNRLILHNGHHRCYALHASGLTHAIAVVQRLSANNVSAVPAIQQAQNLYLESARPPMLTDFLRPELFHEIEVPHRSRQIRLQFGSEQFDAPG